MSQRYCMHCGAVLSPGSRFCAECGRPVVADEAPAEAQERRCPYCGAQNEPGVSFCIQCGAPLGGSRSASADDGLTVNVSVSEDKYGGGGVTDAGAVEGHVDWAAVDQFVRTEEHGTPTELVDGDRVIPATTRTDDRRSHEGPGAGGDRARLPLAALAGAAAALLACAIGWTVFGGGFGRGVATDGPDDGETVEQAEEAGEQEEPPGQGSASESEDEAIARAKEQLTQETTTTPEPTTEDQTTTQDPAPSAGTAQISIPGVDGTVRNETIRLDGSSERVFRDSNTRVLGDEEVARLTDAELCIAWNEIIAAKGYVFKNDGLWAYFSSCSWYSPDPHALGDTSGLPEASRINVEKLQSALRDRWWREKLT